MRLLFATVLFIFPGLLFAADGLFAYIPSILVFFKDVFIPFLIGVAFLILIINVVRYFVVESASQEGREKARAYILYSVLGFVFILVFWGIINLLTTATGLDDCEVLDSDYVIFHQVKPDFCD